MHKAFRVLLRIVVILIVLLFAIALSLQIGWVQNKVVDTVTGILNNNSNFHTEIGKIKLTWWDALELEDVEIRDHKDSLMISGQTIYADFSLLSILPPGSPTIDAVRLEHGNLHLITHEGDSSINIGMWVTELAELFSSSSTKKSTTNFYINSIELRDAEVFILNENYPALTEGLDYTHLKFGDISLDAKKFRVENGVIGANIQRMEGQELNSKLPINEFTTSLTYSPEFLEFDKLSLKTDHSHIKDFIRFEYATTSAFSNFLKEVVVITNLDEAELDLGDLKLFAPSLPQIDDRIIITGEVAGPLADIRSKELLLRIGKKTEVFGAIRLQGLPDIEETYINLSLKNSTIETRDLAPYISKEVAKEINKFKTIRFTADFAGFLRRFTTNGKFSTAIGDINGRVNFDIVDGLPTTVSNITVKNLDLGILADEPKLLQKVSLSGRVNTRGNSKENILLDVDAHVSKIGVNHYQYTNINTDATYGLDLFRGNLKINDPNLKITANGELNLRESMDSVRMKLQIDTAFLDRLNLTEKAAFISGNLDIDVKGIELDDIQGIARFINIEAGYEDRRLHVGNFYFQSLFAGGTRTMSVNSDYLVAAASGQFNLEQMSSDLDILLDQYLSIMLNEEQPIADLEKNFSEEYNLDLNLRMFNINPIIQLFEPDLYISQNTILEGAFYQTKENTVFNFFTSIDTLKYQGNTAEKVNIDFNTSKLINSPDILASFYVFSKTQEVGKSLQFTNLGFEAIWDRDVMDMNFTLDQDSTETAIRMDAYAKFSALNTQLAFQPTTMKLLNRDWKFDSLNLMTITPGEVTIDNLKLYNEEQKVALEGKVSRDPNERLNLSIANVNIDLLNTLFPQNFDGTANGLISFENLLDSALVQGNLSLQALEINKFPIGDVEGSAYMNQDKIQLAITNKSNGRKTIDIGGSIGTKDQRINVDASLKDASLVILEPFLANYLSNMGGTVSGDIEIRGTTDSPEVDGLGQLNEGKLTVNYLQSTYFLNGVIDFDPNRINLQNIVMRDVMGNRARLTGGITHNGFSNILIDISADMTNLQVMNTTVKDNEIFYGTAYVTGRANVKGSTTNLDITARATSQPRTRIFIPLTSDNTQAQEDFIHMINVRDTVRIQQIAEEVNRLEIENIRMNFVLDITPDAYTEIIIDPRTEEGISGRGNGVLTMNIDTQGNFTLNGTYEITEGKYNFSLYNVLKKEFDIRPGGRINWFGDPYKGIMNLSAEYTETVSLQPLMANTRGLETDNSTSSRRYPVKVLMNLEGELLSPEINFGFDFSEFPTNGEMQTTISSFQNKIASDEQEMNRQVFSVIMTRGFSPEGTFSGVANISSSLGQLISSQLNSFLGQVDKNLEIDFDVASLDQSALENFQLSVAYTFLDGRLRVSRDGGFTDNQGNANAAAILGDWQAEYLLTEDGVYRIRIFNRNNFNTFTSLSLAKNITTYGVSLSQNVSFNSFSELFRKITRKNEEKDQEKGEGRGDGEYLKNQEEDWQIINLDDVEQKLDSINQVRLQRIIEDEF